MSSHLRVYDLAGLCDRVVAHTLMSRPLVFREYVFANARPTFIHVHGAWADWAHLHADDRLHRDYYPLHEVWSRPHGAERGEDGEPWIGDYVRRDMLGVSISLLERFRRAGLENALP